MPARIPDHIRAEIVRQYTVPLPDGTWKGSKLIGRDLGIADVTVLNILRQGGIAIRTSKEAHAHGKRCGRIKHPEQFDAPPLCACGCGEHVYWNKNKQVWAKFTAGHYRKDAPYKDGEWLCEQYEARRRSANDIAVECRVNVTTVIRQMERHGIARRDASASKIGRFEGAKNPAWKGGVAQWNYAPQWKRIARVIRKRDNYTCQICHTPHPPQSRVLHVHHQDGDKTNNEPSNLLTVCAACHPKGKRKEAFNTLRDPHWRGKWLVSRKGDVLGIDAVAYMTSREAADRLRVTPSHMAGMVKDGRITGRRVGYFWYVERASLEAYAATYQRKRKHKRSR